MFFTSLEYQHKKMYTAIVEMPLGTKHKYEIDKITGELTLDRVIPVSVPVNYGFIINTLSEDGDAIDVFIASMEPIPPLTRVLIEVVGIIKCVDDGKEDNKVLAYIKDDTKTKSILNTEDLTSKVLQYLKTYKKTINVEECLGLDDAIKAIEESSDLFFLETT
jgi:inorganic pyrophosphatase